MRRVVLALVIVLWACASLGAQEAEKTVPLQGTQAFRQILDYHKLQPLSDFTELQTKNPKETIVIVFGTFRPDRKTQVLDQVAQVTGGLRSFLNSGGALLVASDQNDGPKSRLAEIGIVIFDSPPEHPDRLFLDQPECPVIFPTLVDGRPHAIFQNVSRDVATNGPASVTGPLIIARFTQRAGLRGVGFAAQGPGRSLVMGDQDVFSNSMMLRLDSDNYQFAWNCVRWLQESEDGQKRKYALFVENGTIETSFKGPLAITMPPLSLATVVNQVLVRMEEENFFNEVLHRLVPAPWIWRGVLIVATALLIFFGRRWLLRGRDRPPAGLPLVDQSVAAMMEELPLLSRRHRAMIKSGNFYEAARALGRHFFALHAGPAVERGLPALHSAGSGWQQRARRAKLQRLWDLAYGATPAPVSAGRLADVVTACQTLEDDLEGGALLFPAFPATKH